MPKTPIYVEVVAPFKDKLFRCLQIISIGIFYQHFAWLDVEYFVFQLAETIKKHTPLEIIKAEFTSDPDKRDYIVSSQKIYDKGYSCDYDLDDGIKQMIKVYNLIDEPWYANY